MGRTGTTLSSGFDLTCLARSALLTPESTRTRMVRSDASPSPNRETEPRPEVVWRSINAIRALSMDAVEQAQSGHPGTPMALAPAAYLLWTRFLRHNPKNPDWPDRDRFVLSCGHASMLLYSLLHLSGYDLPLEEIKQFRQWGSLTPGHPERGHTPGVETTTGPLGQGFGNAVGMAMAERFLADHFNRPEHSLVDHRVWAFASDGDLMEGVASEAASLAGHLRLGKLTVIYDDNHVTIDGDTALTFSEDVPRRFEGYGWRVLKVGDGNDLAAITAAFETARSETTRPTLIVLRTVIADPAPTKRNSAEAHGAPLGAEEVRRTKEIMGWPVEPKFYIPDDALGHWRSAVARGAELETSWCKRRDAYAAAYPEMAAQFDQWLSGELPEGWDKDLSGIVPAGQLATRQASGLALQAIATSVPNLIGGSADLGGSTGTTLKQGGTFGPTTSGRTFHWGVREHGMAACLNGIAAHGGLRPFGSTFLVFSDYMKPAIRLAAIMRLPVIYIGTHDSIGLGEDGPTHQPVEHLAMLRSIPNLVTLRPADAGETIQAWRVAIERREGPTMLVLTRQKLPVLDRTAIAPAEGVRRGAYVLLDPPGGGTPDSIIIATGSEVAVALDAARLLHDKRIRTRVVSMPSWELFAAQPDSYRDSVLPPAIRARVAVEAAGPVGWSRWTTDDGVVVGMKGFGASAPGERLFQEFNLTPDHVAAAVQRLLSR
jgi:transketolase